MGDFGVNTQGTLEKCVVPKRADLPDLQMECIETTLCVVNSEPAQATRILRLVRRPSLLGLTSGRFWTECYLEKRKPQPTERIWGPRTAGSAQFRIAFLLSGQDAVPR